MKYSVIILVVFISFQTFSQKTYKLNKKLEVMMEDLGKMKFEDAKKACIDLGEGWRLPTKKELKLLYRKSDEIGGFTKSTYWSSKELGDGWIYGYSFRLGSFKLRGGKHYVRAVRTKQ
jgi:hypothetical protein